MSDRSLRTMESIVDDLWNVCSERIAEPNISILGEAIATARWKVSVILVNPEEVARPEYDVKLLFLFLAPRK